MKTASDAIISALPHLDDRDSWRDHVRALEDIDATFLVVSYIAWRDGPGLNGARYVDGKDVEAAARTEYATNPDAGRSKLAAVQRHLLKTAFDAIRDSPSALEGLIHIELRLTG